MADSFTLHSQAKQAFTLTIRSGESFQLSAKTSTFSLLGANRGLQGAKGVGADDLEPRIVALEQSNDGLQGGQDPLAFYILSRNP